MTTTGIHLPVEVNGTRVEWLFDTAFSHAAVAESEARMLRLSLLGSAGQTEGFSGGSTTTRVAMAERLVIGDAEVRNVPILVFPDSQPPWSDRPVGKRGTIALPIIAALDGIQWNADGQCQLGATPGTPAAGGNLAFDGMTPITRVRYDGSQLDFVLDTGNQSGTQFWQRFAREFPALVQGGALGTRRVNQIGGSRDYPVVLLPQLRLSIGGLGVTLAPAHVFAEGIGTEFQHGVIGMDLLQRASAVAIDLRAMSLTLR